MYAPAKSIMLGESFVLLPAEKPYEAPPIGVVASRKSFAIDNFCPQLTPLQRHYVEQLESAEREQNNMKYKSHLSVCKACTPFQAFICLVFLRREKSDPKHVCMACSLVISKWLDWWELVMLLSSLFFPLHATADSS